MAIQHKNSAGSSFAKKILLQIGIRISIVITLSALISYFHIYGVLESQVQNSLLEYITERGEKESFIFTNAEKNHQKLSTDFLHLWLGDFALDELRYNSIFHSQADGTTRLSLKAFTGIKRADGSTSQYLSAYIGTKAPIYDAGFRRKLWLSYVLLDRYAPGWTVHDYPNLYISMPENVNIVYWPGIPWGAQADVSLDVNTEEWVYVANSENNPRREPAWTGLYYDQTADEWMVSLETPVDHNSEHLINIGHDILLNTLFERVFNDSLEGTYNFIFRDDGRIIAHPKLVTELKQKQGVLHASETGDVDLQNMIMLAMLQQPRAGLQSTIIEDSQSNALLAVTRIAGPGWYFVTVYPRLLLASTALSIAYIVGIVGLVSLVVELLIFFRIIRLQVLEPIQSFWRFTKKITNREFEALDSSGIQTIRHRNDEIGDLANSMDYMANTIYKYESELENLVEEQTREVRSTNLKLQQESTEKENIVSLLQTIARDVSGLQGNDYFNSMSSFLAESLEADFVLICRLADDGQSIHSLSACLHNKIIENIEYSIAGTPCEVVINEGPQTFDGNVKELFPDDQDLVDLDLNSYIGTPMFDSDQKCIGHLAVMRKGRFTEVEKVKLVMDSVSSRASSELLRQVTEEFILRQATTDNLTGLMNRVALMESLRQFIPRADRNQQQLAVAFIDLDNFKLVNDSYGHAVGDEFLANIGQRLKQSVRGGDLVGRLGGDEFVIVLDLFNSVDSSAAIIEKIRSQVHEEILTFNANLPLSCSIGIAVFPEDGDNCDELVNNADRAMYRAKEQGKNRVQFFTAVMNSQLERRQQVELDLRQAISENQLVVFYQPMVCLKRNEIVKFEALVRWNHPERGLVAPDDFISIAEQTGQIIDIGKIVLRQVCEDFSQLKSRYTELTSVSVNFSARQFSDPTILQYLLDIVKASNLNYDCIDMEITESVFIDSEDKLIIETLVQLREIGFKISLDDFGTGYSSLAYLKKFPVDILKIDRDFIHDLTENPQSKALVNSIIDLAQHFSLTVVGEGVETIAQENILKQLNCNIGQGYLYAKPKCLEDVLSDSI